MASRRRWTDDALRAAVTSSTTHAMVMSKLGLSPKGGNYYSVRERISELGLSTEHFTGQSGNPRRPWSDEELRAAVGASRSLGEVIERLAVGRGGGMEQRVRRRIRLLRLDTKHFSRDVSRARRVTSWTDEALRVAVASARSIAQVLRALGLVPAGGNYDQVQRRIRALGLDTTHLVGGAWRRGLSTPVRPSLPLEAILVSGRWIGSHSLKQRLFKEGLKEPACELCGWAEPRPTDGIIPVELDHVNGDKTDNRLVNLRVVCPNCHSLQPTHRALNRRRRAERT